MRARSTCQTGVDEAGGCRPPTPAIHPVAALRSAPSAGGWNGNTTTPAEGGRNTSSPYPIHAPLPTPADRRVHPRAGWGGKRRGVSRVTCDPPPFLHPCSGGVDKGGGYPPVCRSTPAARATVS